MNINRLKQEIEHQTRNGRTEVYVQYEDLKELIKELEGSYGKQRIMLDKDYLLQLIDEYEEQHKNDFKDSLKVSVNTKLVKQDGLNYEFEEIER